MFLRRASHGVSPAVTLDFLVPNSARRLSSIQLTTSPREYVASSGSKRIVSRAYVSSPSTTPMTSGASSQLDEDLRILAIQPLASATGSQADAFLKAVPLIRTVFNKRNITRIAGVWDLFKSQGLLAFFGPAQCGIISRFVSGYITSTRRGYLVDDETRILSEIALFCAAGGWTPGLKQLMIILIQSGKPKEVAALYDQYVSRLTERNLLLGSSTDASPPHPSDDARTEELAEAETEDAAGHGPTGSNLIRDDVLLCAVAARMQYESFADILPMFIHASTRVATSTFKDILPQLDDSLAAQVEPYVRRLETAALLSRPEALSKHIANLNRDHSNNMLARLYSRAIEGLHEPSPWLAVRPRDLSGTRIVLLPPFFWTTFLTCFLAARRTDLAEKLWDDMLKAGVQPGIATWNALMDGYVGIRLVDAALSTWDVMVSQNVQPDALSYRAVILGLFKQRRSDEAMARFKEFERKLAKPGARFTPSTVLTLYNTVVHQLLMLSQDTVASGVLHKMEEKGPVPDVPTYNIFLRYYARTGNLKAMAGTLRRLESRGLKADAYTFSTLLSAMLEVRPDADQMMINFMKKQGITPDTVILTSVINHQVREGTLRGLRVAMDLLSKMERNRYENAEPNAITYTSILVALNRGQFKPQLVHEYNQRIWDAMVKRSIQPTAVAYNVLIKAALGLPGSEGLEKVMSYWRDMVTQRVHMSNDTWFILLRGLLDRGDTAMAGEMVVQLVRDRGGNVGAITGALRTLVDEIEGVKEEEE